MKMEQPKWRITALLLALLLVAVLVAACGKADQNKDTEGSAVETTASSGTEQSAAEVKGNTEEAAQGEAAEASGTKIVSTAFGDIEVPIAAKRIVADDYLGTLIALDAIPVGTPGLHLKNPYYIEALKGVEDTGDYGNASSEKMIALQPDLIITATSDDARFEQMNKIAPTISIPYGELKNAHEELAYFGELLGLKEKADEWLSDYDKRIAAAKARVDAAIPADASFTIFERSDKATWVYGDNFGRGGQPIYQALGRAPKAEVADEIMEKQWKELSMEILPEYAGDYLVVTVSSTSEWNLQKFKEDPIWGSLEAVKQDRIYIWPEERSWYYDPIAVLAQTEELANWLAP
ncbi:ABC transporter substrate-binding protein [Paenibacillus sp. CAU 1782]